MTSERLLRRLTIFLVPLGAIVAVFGIVTGDHIQTTVGVMAVAFGILTYAYVRRTPVDELLHARRPTFAILVTHVSGTVVTFATTAYLLAVVDLVDLAVLTSVPSSWILTFGAVVLGAVTTGGISLLVNNTDDIAVEIFLKRLDLVVFVGVLVVIPETSLIYAGAYVVCLIGVYIYSRSLE